MTPRAAALVAALSLQLVWAGSLACAVQCARGQCIPEIAGIAGNSLPDHCGHGGAPGNPHGHAPHGRNCSSLHGRGLVAVSGVKQAPVAGAQQMDLGAGDAAAPALWIVSAATTPFRFVAAGDIGPPLIALRI